MKSQASVELLSLVALGGIVLAGVTVISFVYSQQLNAQKSFTGGNELCLFLASEINTAASFGEGFERSFILPFSATQFSFLVEFNNAERKVFVFWEGGGCSKPLLSEVSGSLNFQGSNFLRFNNGVVVLN